MCREAMTSEGQAGRTLTVNLGGHRNVQLCPFHCAPRTALLGRSKQRWAKNKTVTRHQNWVTGYIPKHSHLPKPF